MLQYPIDAVIQRVEIGAGSLHPAIDIGMPVKYPCAVVVGLCLEYQCAVPVNDH